MWIQLNETKEYTYKIPTRKKTKFMNRLKCSTKRIVLTCINEYRSHEVDDNDKMFESLSTKINKKLGIKEE